MRLDNAISFDAFDYVVLNCEYEDCVAVKDDCFESIKQLSPYFVCVYS